MLYNMTRRPRWWTCKQGEKKKRLCQLLLHEMDPESRTSVLSAGKNSGTRFEKDIRIGEAYEEEVTDGSNDGTLVRAAANAKDDATSNKLRVCLYAGIPDTGRHHDGRREEVAWPLAPDLAHGIEEHCQQ